MRSLQAESRQTRNVRDFSAECDDLDSQPARRRALWCAALFEIVMSEPDTAATLRWLKSIDGRAVCEFAGIDPGYFIRKVEDGGAVLDRDRTNVARTRKLVSKLSDEDVDAIREFTAARIPELEIAKAYGVTCAAVAEVTRQAQEVTA